MFISSVYGITFRGFHILLFTVLEIDIESWISSRSVVRRGSFYFSFFPSSGSALSPRPASHDGPFLFLVEFLLVEFSQESP